MGKLQKLGLINQEEARHEAELDEAKRAGRRNTIRRLRDAALDREQENQEATDEDLDEFEASLAEPAETDPSDVDEGVESSPVDDGTDLETVGDEDEDRPVPGVDTLGNGDTFQSPGTDDNLNLTGEPEGAAHTETSETEPASDDADDEALTGSDEEA